MSGSHSNAAEGAAEYDLRVLSLGAGVQSTAVYLLAVEGALGKLDAAIFADTQSEPPWVYEHLDWLEAKFGDQIPIYRPTAGDLGRDVLDARDGSRWSSVPFWVRGSDGSAAPLRRQCTREYKIDVVKRQVRELLGLKKGERAQGRYKVEEWIGISLDEVTRAKPSRYKWITTRWPLLFDRPMTRGECLAWMRKRGYPQPGKSACTFCPYRDTPGWAAMKLDAPDVFAQAVRFDEQIRNTGQLIDKRQEVYVHSSLVPLGEVDLSVDDSQINLFENECEGMCGV